MSSVSFLPSAAGWIERRSTVDEGYFVDWISCSQYHGKEAAPEFVGSMSFKFDDAGDVICETGGSRAIKGSHDTSLQVRSHGGWVSVSGNPGRFGRPDNLFGLDLDRCMDVINRELALHDLPPFTKGEEMRPSSEELERGVLPRWTGCAFSRIDITRGFETGSEFAARLAMRAYSRISVGRMTRSTWGGETALWRTGRRVVKAYLKGAEMIAHGHGGEWADYAKERGIVRHEVELKSKYLSETGLRHWGNLTMGELIRIHVRETEHLQNIDTGCDPVAIESIPRNCRMTYAAWLKGENVRELLTRPTYYRHRKALLEFASVDIQDLRDVGSFVQPQVRVVELRPAVAPVHYWQAAA